MSNRWLYSYAEVETLIDLAHELGAHRVVIRPNSRDITEIVLGWLHEFKEEYRADWANDWAEREYIETFEAFVTRKVGEGLRDGTFQQVEV